MHTDREPVLERLHEELAQALQRTGRSPGAPVTVAEIYQELVPYRAVRGELGFAMNADYEHALLRLLGGEDDRARLEPDRAVEAIRRELQSTNPNVGIYRDFAACEVWVAPGHGDASADRADDGPAQAVREPIRAGAAEPGPELELEVIDESGEAADDWSALEQLGHSNGGADMHAQPFVAPAEAAPEPAAAQARTPTAPPAQAARHEGETVDPACVYCDSQLPAGRQVRFCPYCGGDQTTLPCGACGEVLEDGWMYCVACGTARTG